MVSINLYSKTGALMFFLCIVGVLTAAGRVVRDQADADEDLSIKQRVALAGGSAIGGTGEALGATLGEEFQPLTDALDVTSKCIDLLD